MKNILILTGFILILAGCSNQTETITIDIPQEVVVEEISENTTVSVQTLPENSAIQRQQLNEIQPVVKKKVAEATVNTEKEQEIVVENENAKEQSVIAESEPEKEEIKTVTIEIPKSVEHDVVFAAQAPFANWALPYKEACEEASLIMASRYVNGQSLDNTIMDNEILKLVDWQNETFGYYEDTNTDEMIRTAQEYFGLSVRKIVNPSVNIMKKELADGNLIVVPVDGQALQNPYFRQPGPPYHVLVLTGYDSDEFISNDPGTKRGEDFKYKYNDLLDVIHDFNDGDIKNGTPMVIVVEK